MPRALLLVLILSLLGCSEQTDTLRIGANRWLGYGVLYLADDLHWMTPSGYRLVEYPHTTGVLRGYRNGLLDAALLTLDEALILQSSGMPVQILLVADVSAGADVLFANAQIQQLAQLRGQRIGVENSALGAFFLSRILDLAKLPANEISVIDMPVNEHLHALREGRIDAAINFASASASFAPLGVHPLLDSRALPNEIIDVLVINPQRVSAPQAKHLRELWFTSQEKWFEHRQDIDPRLSRRLGLNSDELTQTLAGLQIGNRALNQQLLNDGTLLRSLNQLNDYLFSRRLQSKPADTQAMLPTCAGATC
ncbi:MAG: nitrate ABC transporter substrate-binding protein [Pseudomonas sp. PGPPP3]|nr:MAG: nitrate ABC transporter substrate-binding protein [Pseudomonas sp. PGPPP3]